MTVVKARHSATKSIILAITIIKILAAHGIAIWLFCGLMPQYFGRDFVIDHLDSELSLDCTIRTRTVVFDSASNTTWHLLTFDVPLTPTADLQGLEELVSSDVAESLALPAHTTCWYDGANTNHFTLIRPQISTAYVYNLAASIGVLTLTPLAIIAAFLLLHRQH